MADQPGDQLARQAMMAAGLGGDRVASAAAAESLGRGVADLLPSFPHESPVPLPRFLARQLWPAGFLPVAAAPVVPLAPPPGVTPAPIAAAPAVVPRPAVPTPPEPAAPPTRQIRPAVVGDDSGLGRLVRVNIAQRRGM